MIYEKELLIGPISPFFGLKTQFTHLAWAGDIPKEQEQI